MSTRRVVHVESARVLLPQARWCDSFGSKLQGFTFRRSLAADEGLVLVERADSRVSAAITMLFVFFDLAIIWVNDAGRIVDTTLARTWRLSYAPQAPARYAVEGHPILLQQVKVGDHIQFLENKT
jgi:uncharacterized membrane protein (UPF0127 family)